MMYASKFVTITKATSSPDALFVSKPEAIAVTLEECPPEYDLADLFRSIPPTARMLNLFDVTFAEESTAALREVLPRLTNLVTTPNTKLFDFGVLESATLTYLMVTIKEPEELPALLRVLPTMPRLKKLFLDVRVPMEGQHIMFPSTLKTLSLHVHSSWKNTNLEPCPSLRVLRFGMTSGDTDIIQEFVAGCTLVEFIIRNTTITPHLCDTLASMQSLRRVTAFRMRDKATPLANTLRGTRVQFRSYA